MSLRYKARGTIATDLHGTRDTVEFLNIAQDDAISWPRPTYRMYPPTVNERMPDAVTPFVRKSMAVNNTILDIFERLLGLPRGALADLHTTDRLSGSEARVVKTPPNQSSVGIGAHTDFGTLVSILGLSAQLRPTHGTSPDVSSQPSRRPPGLAAWLARMALREGMYLFRCGQRRTH